MKKILLFISCACAAFVFAQTPSVNIIQNGMFENSLGIRKTGSTVYSWGAYDEPLRLAEYFNTETMGTYPTMGVAPKYDTYTMPEYEWFQRNNVNYIGRTIINTVSNTSNGYKCLSLINVGHTKDNSAYLEFANSPFKHTVAQRVELENSAAYRLEFYYQAPTTTWTAGQYGTAPNTATKLGVAIIAQNETANNYDYSVAQTISLYSKGDMWHKVEITFDLPHIIDSISSYDPSRILDFSKAAIIFGMEVDENVAIIGCEKGMVNIDKISLNKLPIVETPTDNALITNGSFENILTFNSGRSIYTYGPFAEFLRTDNIFDEQTKGTFPNRGYNGNYYSFTVPNNTWYQSSNKTGSANYAVVNPLSNTEDGTNCLTLHNAGGTNLLNAQSPFEHVAAQRVFLDNTKKYELTFKYQVKDMIWGPSGNDVANNLEKFAVGIVDYNSASSGIYASYMEEQAFEFGDERWMEATVTFDLPALIVSDSQRDFSKAAVLFGIQSPLDSEGVKTLPSAVNIDAVSLIEKITNSNNNVFDSKKPTVIMQGNVIRINSEFQNISIYNVLGSPLHQSGAGSDLEYTFSQKGIYIIKVDENDYKILVK